MIRLVKTVVKAYKGNTDIFFYNGDELVNAFSIYYPVETLDLDKTVEENMVDIKNDVLDLWRNGNTLYILDVAVFNQEMKKIATLISPHVS